MERYQTEVRVKRMEVAAFLNQYYKPEQFADSCKACPFYGHIWSCPPGTPQTEDFFRGYREIYLIGVKLIYGDENRKKAYTRPMTETIRQQSYGEMKKILHELYLQMEHRMAGTKAIAAGRCEQCQHCARLDGHACKQPGRRRYSFSAFRIDLSAVAERELGMPLLWSSRGLPDYELAMSALLVP